MTEIEIINEYFASISKKFNYVYLITELSSNRKYIGVRSCDISIENDLGKIYKSSSSDLDFINRQKVNKNDYTYTLLSNYDTRIEAVNEEIRLHNLYDVDVNNKYFNKVKSVATDFTCFGMVNVRDKDGNNFYVSVNHPMYISGELVHMNKGKSVVKDIHGNIIQVDKDDIRIVSGELQYMFKNKVVVKDIDNNIFHVSIDDARYLSGELIPIARGTVSAKDEYGNYFQVAKDDIRLKTGELVGNTKGKVTVKDKDGNTLMTTKDDPRYLSGELIGVTGNWYNIDGTVYSYIQINRIFNISKHVLQKRCNSEEFKNWTIMKCFLYIRH